MTAGQIRQYYEDACRHYKHKPHGMACLGAFLHKSKTLVVLYDVTCFRRLRCCLEFACFLEVSGMNNIENYFLSAHALCSCCGLHRYFLSWGPWAREALDFFGTVGYTSMLLASSARLVWLLRSLANNRTRVSVPYIVSRCRRLIAQWSPTEKSR